MSKASEPVIRYCTPRAGDQVFICPAAGVHGHGSFWAMVVSTTPALVRQALYVRVVPVDEIDGAARVQTFYVRLAGLLTRVMS
ncbi:hypothetical protein Athai_49680 [Actinocatenispora thailandica]|uniref:Uncharacterized protein n=1 Tax=Actinocatenispora thailandica TaxID=227318 RepID=A0A7R7DTG8_9ACTN|nr:hypothetical protein [Actinocatenispora thailandica]BCJ37465.1 hypothetical protein Athai_49680 [Actinocatenispora thailandica]